MTTAAPVTSTTVEGDPMHWIQRIRLDLDELSYHLGGAWTAVEEKDLASALRCCDLLNGCGALLFELAREAERAGINF